SSETFITTTYSLFRRHGVGSSNPLTDQSILESYTYTSTKRAHESLDPGLGPGAHISEDLRSHFLFESEGYGPSANFLGRSSPSLFIKIYQALPSAARSGLTQRTCIVFAKDFLWQQSHTQGEAPSFLRVFSSV